MMKIFKNETNVAIMLGALLISISIVSYGLMSKGSNKEDTLTSLMTVDKIFQGKDF
ncbi:MAG: Thioredoxin-like fold protein, partial [Patescibacteria group bacterium]|nr:Thioredoxin-like fold protein [Patescibacteria group bacterium]